MTVFAFLNNYILIFMIMKLLSSPSHTDSFTLAVGKFNISNTTSWCMSGSEAFCTKRVQSCVKIEACEVESEDIFTTRPVQFCKNNKECELYCGDIFTFHPVNSTKNGTDMNMQDTTWMVAGAVAAVAVVVAVFIWIASYWVYRRRLSRNTAVLVDSIHHYDVFISYAEADSDFVSQMLDATEGSHLVLCFPSRSVERDPVLLHRLSDVFTGERAGESNALTDNSLKGQLKNKVLSDSTKGTHSSTVTYCDSCDFLQRSTYILYHHLFKLLIATKSSVVMDCCACMKDKLFH